MRLKLIIILSINILFSQDTLLNKNSDNIKKIKEEVGTLQTEIDKLIPKVSEFEKANKLEFENIKSNLSDLEKEKETLRNENSILKQELDSINDSLKATQSRYEKRISAIVQNIESDHSTLDSLIKELNIDDDKLGFRNAFLRNRVKGNKTFTWRGKLYNTGFEGEVSNHPLLEFLGQQQDTLQNLIENFNNKINDVNEIIGDLKMKVKDVNKEIFSSNEKIDDVENNLEDNALYIIIALLLIIFGLVGSYIYFNTKFGSHSYSLESIEKSNKKRDKTLESISKNQIEIDAKLLTVLEGIVNKISKEPQSEASEPNHSLAITVCDEVQRMRNRLKIMRSKEEHDEQGVKVITKRLESVEEELNENGYEIVDDTGKPYDSGMKVEASFVEDDTLEKGKEIITRVIKPGVKFNRKQIRNAQIQVNKGTKAE